MPDLTTIRKNTKNGLLGLDGNALTPTANLGTGTANSTTFLRGDRTYATVGVPVTVVFKAADQSVVGS